MRTQNEVDEQLCKLDNIITFNGPGCSGKSTQSEQLAKPNSKKYKHFHSHTLRREFREEIYKELVCMDTCIKYLDGSGTCKTLYQVEVLGFPSLAWLTAYFHWKIKPLQENYIVVLDHYIGDFYIDMLKGLAPSKFQCFVKDHLGIPHFNQGIHFYLDIDYETYEHRWENREKTDPRPDRIKVDRPTFKKRRKRYKELCELKYLKCIDARPCEQKVTDAIQKHLDQHS